MDLKKQHIISKCYLEAWVDPLTPKGQTPYIWLFQKKGGNRKNKSPKKTFRETDFYTIKTKDNGRDLRLEKGLSSLETLFEQVMKRVVEPKNNIDVESKIIICAFVAAMHSRTKAFKQHMSNQFTELLDAMQTAEINLKSKKFAALDTIPDIPPSTNSKVVTSDEIKNLSKNPIQAFLFKMINVEFPILMSMDLAILQNCTNIHFLTSDDPCLYTSKEQSLYLSSPLLHNSVEVIFPLSPCQALLMTRSGTNGYISINESIVKKINRQIKNGCLEYFVGNSENANEF